MSRPIKFRAWDEVNKKMIYEYNGVMTGMHISSGDIINLYENILQFTGLYDKNGKEIYEGDIVNRLNTDNPDNAYIQTTEVFWHEEMSRFSFKNTYDDLTFVDAENCVVIGNVYQNPELIKTPTP